MTRRSLLAGLAPGLCLGAKKPGWRLSTSSVHFRTLPVEEACAAVAKAGYQAIDLWPPSFKCSHLDEVEKRLGASGLKQLLSKHRLSLAAVTTYNLPPTRYARLLGELGGGLLVRESKYGKVTDLHGQMTAFLETLKPDLAAAEENNYRVAIENHRVALLDTLDSIRLFVEMTAPYPRLGIALAPYHLQAAKISVEDAIRAAGSKLFFIYAWQHAEGLAQLPGIGSADFRPWLNALTEIGYTGCTNAFMHGDVPFDSMLENLTKSRRYLESAL